MSIKPLFGDNESEPSTSPDDPSHPRNREGRNSPDGGATGYEKNSPDEFSSRVPEPLERREAEQLGADDRARGYVWPDNPTERPGPDKRVDEDESGF